ncbi:MAG: DUF1330 domain-containing protein [Rhodocyclaceae bacterium]|nr:DUF1330 domain-containing protein [Rhodocyclaceae bacterium]
MPAYLLIQARLTDPVRFRDYAQRAAALVARFGGRYRVLGGQPLQLEGAESDLSTVISEWPDRATALRFWNSPEYAEIKTLRIGTGTFDVKLLDGLEAA